MLDFPDPGVWAVIVKVERDEDLVTTTFDVEIGKPLPNWLSWLGWSEWPAVVVLLYAAHRVLVRRKTARAGYP